MITVFLSSTARDLRAFRDSVHLAIGRMDGYHCIRMEDFGARDWDANEFCRSQVAECDLFVAILGNFHGSCPRGSELSFTELEYQGALEHRKPRLVFFASDAYSVPAELTPEPEEKRNRQAAFRQRVAQERIVDTFSAPDELAVKVALAIRNWEASAPAAARAARNPARKHRSEPNLGRLVSKLCDRRAQTEDFRDFFRDAHDRRPGCPQTYIIPGEVGQCHESLVERLIEEVEKATLDASHEGGSAGRFKRIPWQHDGDAPQRTSRLIYSVFETFSDISLFSSGKRRDLSPQTFAALIAPCPAAYVSIQHDIHAARWDSTTPQAISAYLKFWNGVAQTQNRIPIVIFLSVIYARRESASRIAAMKFVLANLRKKKIRRELNKLASSETGRCRLLDELPPITAEDLLEWFSLHRVYDSDEKRLRALSRLFQGESIRPKAMYEIEAFCAEELKTYVRERGYDDQYQWGNSELERPAVFR